MYLCESKYFFELKPHVKFQNHRAATSVRKVAWGERREGENAWLYKKREYRGPIEFHNYDCIYSLSAIIGTDFIFILHIKLKIGLISKIQPWPSFKAEGREQYAPSCNAVQLGRQNKTMDRVAGACVEH